MVSFDQKPESKRMISSPVAPARRTRATSSSTKRFAPRWVLAGPLAHPGVEDLAGVGPSGEDRVVAEHLGVAVGGSALGLAAHLTDGGVEIDHQLLGPRPAPRDHARRRVSPSTAVELAEMAEGERPEERAERGRRHDPVTEHGFGRPGAQHVGVVDVGATGRHGVHQGQHLASGQGPADRTGDVDSGVDQGFESETAHQCGHEQEPGVGHQIGLVEGHLDAVDSARYCGSLKVPPCCG